MNPTIFAQERLQFGALKNWVYLDHATFGLIPQYALDAMCSYLVGRNTQGVNVNQFFDMWNETDAFRATLGQMVGCAGSEIVYGQSSTALFNIFANGIGLKPGDNVVTTEGVYPADAYVFLNLADKGIELRYAKTTAAGISPEELLSHADDRTKAVVVCMVENQNGFRHDMMRIGQLCRQRNILFAADATQCTNAFPIDVKAMQIDFLTTSLYKWMMGEQGHAFGYISQNLLPNLAQSICGWVGTQDRAHNTATQLKLSQDAKRFELGGINFAAQFGMQPVVRRYLELGAENIEAQIQSLVQRVYERSDELKHFCLVAKLPQVNRSGIVIFKIPDDLTVTDDMLTKRKIRARVMRNNTLRTGFHYINNFEDVDCLIDALKDIEQAR